MAEGRLPRAGAGGSWAAGLARSVPQTETAPSFSLLGKTHPEFSLLTCCVTDGCCCQDGSEVCVPEAEAAKWAAKKLSWQMNCVSLCRRKERKVRTVKDCCLRAAVAIELLTRKKTAAWISSAVEGNCSPGRYADAAVQRPSKEDRYLQPLQVDPLPPGAPKSLRWDSFITGPRASIGGVICWDSPPERDLRIHHYKICISLWEPEQLRKITGKWLMYVCCHCT
ncbi:uncharacterized protein LOC141947458 [Strix uralensis]|uniref:uncharacterized protein LOC141947458 n=1 Tax=Strix uralensis TaxID=36305 RepID=UPI003DA26E21